MSNPRRQFGQRLEVSVALRKLIRDYPGDVGIFKELIQNADDGGAREIRLIFDPRDRDELPTPLPSMRMLCGPAIIAANDQPFSAVDLENIQRLADSEKVESAGKTGRFGLGFNSVYNITDFPLLLTGQHLCLFDPCSAIVGHGHSGEEWLLDDAVISDYRAFLDLFTPGGFDERGPRHQGTIFRFPLRTPAHAQRTQGKISDSVVGPEVFDRFVQGLSEIADSILLFLKHLEFIGCYRVDPLTSKCVPLLEIQTLNADCLRLGRAKVNEGLLGTVDIALKRIASASEGRITNSYYHEISVAKAAKDAYSVKWRVTTGLFAGKGGRLVEHAQALRRHHEKAIPSAGVAVCLERSRASFPTIGGQVCCFLPLGSKPGTFPVQLHGAFDIDSSRSDLTPHSAGEDERKRLRGLWNELLVEDGLAEAYRQTLELVKEKDLDRSLEGGEAEAFYSLFPRQTDVISGPLTKLSGAVFAKVASLPMFRCADGTWYSPADLIRAPDDDAALQAALVAEEFPVPQPRIPDPIVHGLGEAAPPTLEASDLYEHFHTEEDIDLSLREVTYPGLRIRSQLEAVVAFLVQDQNFDDWKGLPLALCSDNKLHTFGTGSIDVKFHASARQRRIFTAFPEWFLDERFVNATSLTARSMSGVRLMTAAHVASLVNLVTGSAREDDEFDLAWNPSSLKPPNREWLAEVLMELNSAPEWERPGREITDAAYLIPGNDGCLHRPGQYQTPLLIKPSQKPLCRILKEVGILHFQLGDDSLSKELERFASVYECLWNLTPKNLAESLTESEALIENQENWAREDVVMSLLRFLSTPEGLEEIGQDAGLIENLCRLPLFEDQTGTFASIDASCFLPGEFSSPQVKLPNRLLQETGWRGLLDLLGVQALDRRTLFRDYVLPSYESKEELDQLRLLKWIRDEWIHILDECENDEKSRELSDLLEETPLVRTTQGSLAAITDIYDPEHQELVESVLGDAAAFPDLSFYAEQKDIWLRFFRSFRLAVTPRPQDLAGFIAGLSAAAVERPPTRDELRKAELFLSHITEYWESLREQPVTNSNGDEVEFSSFLADLAWCPVMRDLDRLQQFGALAAPEARFFKPSEIFLAEQGNLVASQSALLKQGRRAPSAEMREDLKFRGAPTPEIVIAHLRVLAAPYGTRELTDAESKLVQNPARVILEYFGRFESDEDTPFVTKEAIKGLRDLAGVYHPTHRRFYRPRDIFRSAPPCLAPWKIEFVPGGTTKALLSDAVDLLGRSEQPAIADYVETLRGIASTVPAFSKLDENQTTRFLEVQAAMTRLLGPDTQLEDCPVLDRHGCVAEPTQVLHLDDAWLESNMKSGLNLRLLHQHTPELLIEHLRVARVSRLLKKVLASEATESENQKLEAECARIEAILSDEEFRRGFRRIAACDHGAAGAEIALSSSFELNPVISISCANRVEFNGGIVDLAVTDEDFCVEINEGERGVIWLAETALEDLPDRVALALNELLPVNQRIDNGNLAAILRCPPSEIDRQLSRRRIPQIMLAEVKLEKGAAPVQEIEFEDVIEEGAGEADDNRSSAEGEAEHGEDSVLPAEGDDGALSNDKDEPVAINEDAVADLEEDELGTGTRVEGSRGARRAGERRQPMYPGKSNGSIGKVRHHAPKRQDDLWISRPKTEKQVEEEQRSGDASDDEVPINHRVGNAAVGWVLQFERIQGRKPQSMAHANAGYDVESKQGRIIERYIEVKGINGEWGKNGVPLSAIQFEKARELGDKFWLYVVENALEAESVRIHTIQDPFSKTSQYRFDLGWSECGEPASFVALEPKEGIKIFTESDGFGEILHASLSGSTWHLKVRFDENSPYKNVVYNPLFMQLIAVETDLKSTDE